MNIPLRRAVSGDLDAVARLALLLWPGHTPDALKAELRPWLERPDAAVFLAGQEDAPTGFAQCGLRRDDVPGAYTSPVAYLEGVYVLPANRHSGVAAALVHACEAWARQMGCAEFASDCALANTGSIGFHRAMGFRETERLVFFIKPLAPPERND